MVFSTLNKVNFLAEDKYYTKINIPAIINKVYDPKFYISISSFDLRTFIISFNGIFKIYLNTKGLSKLFDDIEFTAGSVCNSDDSFKLLDILGEEIYFNIVAKRKYGLFFSKRENFYNIKIPNKNIEITINKKTKRIKYLRKDVQSWFRNNFLYFGYV